jgi:glycopeptide antibiotics resistance protein
MDTETRTKARNISLVLLGTALLVFKSRYAGPFETFVHSYVGNVSVSFAIYFLALHIPLKTRHKRLWTVCIALATVELFELFNGFGLMSNVYDSWDLIANLVGVAIAFALDVVLSNRQSAATNA